MGGMTLAKWHKFARLHAVEDHLRLGWAVTQALRGTYHGQFAVHMVWLCACDVAVPK